MWLQRALGGATNSRARKSQKGRPADHEDIDMDPDVGDYNSGSDTEMDGKVIV